MKLKLRFSALCNASVFIKVREMQAERRLAASIYVQLADNSSDIRPMRIWDARWNDALSGFK